MAQAPRPSNGFKNKQNVNPSLDRNTEATAEDFQEAASLFEWFADWVDNQVQPEKFYQFHTSLENLAAAHPNAVEDGWAIIVPENGNTPFVATFTNGEWVASQVEPPVQFFDTKIARDQAGDGQEGIFYIIKDSKLISLWYNNKYNDFGKDGNNGLDAYQVALAFGFDGTEQEWLASLNGKSAYQIAVDNGFEGTEAEWVESLGGIEGKSAYQVWLDAGNQGTEADFFLSITGPDGKSVYQTWLDEGNQGTEADFLASLEGDPGDPGKSTYQIWLDAGNQGTEADFLLSIKGEPGVGFENIPAEANKIPVTDGEGGINWEDKPTGGTGNQDPIPVTISRPLAATDNGKKLLIEANVTLTYPAAGLGSNFEFNAVCAAAGTLILADENTGADLDGGTFLAEGEIGHAFYWASTGKLTTKGDWV